MIQNNWVSLWHFHNAVTYPGPMSSSSLLAPSPFRARLVLAWVRERTPHAQSLDIEWENQWFLSAEQTAVSRTGKLLLLVFSTTKKKKLAEQTATNPLIIFIYMFSISFDHFTEKLNYNSCF